MKNIKQLFSPKLRSRTFSYLMVIVFYAIIQTMITTKSLSSLMKGLLVPLCAYSIAAVALNLVVGILGDLSLGQGGFMSIGGYFGAFVAAVTMQYIDNTVIVLIISVIGGAFLASIFGVLIGVPILKLEGDYLAIVTLAFGQIVKTIVSNIYLGIDSKGIQFAFINDTTRVANDGRMIINGPIGLLNNPRISTFTFGVVLLIVALFVVYNLIYSKQGRAIMAVRDNKIAALSVGIKTSKFKLIAFVVSAALAGAAGAFYCMNYATVSPAKFDFNLSIMILVYVVLGGLGKVNGTLIATAALLIIPEKLRGLNDYRMIIYAVILIAIMLIKNNETINEQYTRLYNSVKDKAIKLFKKKGAN